MRARFDEEALFEGQELEKPNHSVLVALFGENAVSGSRVGGSCWYVAAMWGLAFVIHRTKETPLYRSVFAVTPGTMSQHKEFESSLRRDGAPR